MQESHEDLPMPSMREDWKNHIQILFAGPGIETGPSVQWWDMLMTTSQFPPYPNKIHQVLWICTIHDLALGYII